ncbi:MAG: glycine cleavage system protein GcvH [Geminicoccaceae bacterium]|nr:glycine cleavage system protein GcvH [Geminicoccaceae bacterium]MCS7268718.1 glycine cleavage system protein GcvH [Geminicoccaceae bacterium]MDW8125569.1 glycine cleavage system protein GcvH [Geminicoccaceae bacterium]MDW8342208.1 glycine cleavage system protein GcvH [Geminicoccaceae bacterium]
MTIYYTKEHEWIRVEGGIATVGISEHAQEQLGDVVYVELPEVGREVAAGEPVAVVESVKAASDVYSPVSGRIVDVNRAIADNPALVNEDAEGAAWFFRIELADPSELGGLMNADAYREYLSTLS